MNKKGKEVRRRSRMREILIRLFRNKAAVVGMILLAILILVAIFADQIVSYEDVAIKRNMEERLQSPSAEHWFGTD